MRIGTGIVVGVWVMVPTHPVVVVMCVMLVMPAVAVLVLVFDRRGSHMNVRPRVVTGNLPTMRVDEGY